MEHLRFEMPNFVEDYKEALVKFAESQSEGGDANLDTISDRLMELYMDPDCVVDRKYTPYFNWLALFLNLRAWECGKPYKFVAPSDAGIKLCSEAKNPKWFLSDGYKYGNDRQKALEQDQSKILVFDEEDKRVLRLFSDQLGFTAIQDKPNKLKSKWNDDRYPLYRYLKLAENKNVAAEFISRYVYDTRTLGGAFIWPTDCVKEPKYYRGGRRYWGRQCEYNVQRGVGDYIEDRVDLTLLEVKSYLNGSKIEGHEEPILLNDYVMYPSGEKNMKAFLEDIFDSFEDYVDFFMLNDFVVNVGKADSKDYVPKDITTGKAFERNENDKFVIGERLSERRDLSESELKEILGRVQSWTIKRTGKMENYLEKMLEPYAVC